MTFAQKNPLGGCHSTKGLDSGRRNAGLGATAATGKGATDRAPTV
jgi:hypothetical protein